MSKKGIFLTSGFLLFVTGISSLALHMVGIKYVLLQWIDFPGALFGFIIRLIMMVLGVILVVVGSTNWEQERKDSAPD